MPFCDHLVHDIERIPRIPAARPANQPSAQTLCMVFLDQLFGDNEAVDLRKFAWPMPGDTGWGGKLIKPLPILPTRERIDRQDAVLLVVDVGIKALFHVVMATDHTPYGLREQVFHAITECLEIQEPQVTGLGVAVRHALPSSWMKTGPHKILQAPGVIQVLSGLDVRQAIRVWHAAMCGQQAVGQKDGAWQKRPECRQTFADSLRYQVVLRSPIQPIRKLSRIDCGAETAAAAVILQGFIMIAGQPEHLAGAVLGQRQHT